MMYNNDRKDGESDMNRAISKAGAAALHIRCIYFLPTGVLAFRHFSSDNRTGG